MDYSKTKAKVVMYSKDYCPYCDRARTFFENNQIPFQEIDLSNNEAEINRIKEETGWRTVPIILIDDKLVGGYSDLKALADSEELAGLLGL